MFTAESPFVVEATHDESSCIYMHLAELEDMMNNVYLRREIEVALNRASAENQSDTPDFILAEFLIGCLRSFDAAVNRRREWWGEREMSGFGHTGQIVEPDHAR